jgi:uncharacterized membrane protein YeaQ/YmgE (transglycosylase-associated protein family)
MQAVYQDIDPTVWGHLWDVAQVLAVAELAGWIADRILDTGIRLRGVTLFAGLLGAFGGRWLVHSAGWSEGPTVAGFPLVAAFGGALGVCAVLKLIGLSVAGSR